MQNLVKYYVRLPEDLLNFYRRKSLQCDVPANALLWFVLNDYKTREESKKNLERWINSDNGQGRGN
jgi:hypothetical protein